ncbi:hypothetical protein PV328_010275 [Microctonus aethiopoides]|uniref:Nucleolar complex protein 3 homolog n=1 Tax=Microctonus aethiopoides TaxID=144406 RepID=A0AA39C7M7_9HYME|nr:hypothetical protein PV328_010275 [Microctonus aethiopoides]
MPKRKTKISAVKRNNQKRTKLSKQGKLKLQKHRGPKKQIVKQNVHRPEEVVEEESDQGEDLMEMVEADDLKFLQSAISNKSYRLLEKIRLNDTSEPKVRRGKRKTDDSVIEDKYEEAIDKINEEGGMKKMRLLLPVKTKDGVIKKRIIEEEIKEEEEDYDKENDEKVDENDEELDSDTEVISELKSKEIKNIEQVSNVELLACRDEVLRSKKFKIGILASSLLENPEIKIKNLGILLELMDETNTEVYITVRKLATVSLLEVFKDILPSYHINSSIQEGIKLKKDTFQLQNYETALLKYYKIYLQKLEKMAGKLRKKKGDTRIIPEPIINLGDLAVSSMCDLLITNPYFNFSSNIANFLIPFLDNKRLNVREKISNCFSQIFKDDKRGELSLTIVRKINQYIKTHGHSVHCEVVTVLLSLKIKNIDLDKEREDDAKQKKLMNHKQRILALSKRERKRSKKLEAVEKEMLESKAEENKVKKQKLLTEITSVVFTIYFRILKEAPNSKVLSCCLEGLAKFAHCINLEFYQDLVQVINRLMEDGNLGQREQLHCIQTVFTILSGQGSALNIDPYRFYVHLYKILLNVDMGKTQDDCEIVIKCLVQVLIERRKRLSQNRMVTFVKRIATLALQLQHHGALGILGVVKSIFQLSKSANILLDTDNNSGDGFYQPELEEPEYCNAHCTALWELTALQRHYHIVVQKIARNIAMGVPTSGEGSLPSEISKLSAENLYNEYNPSGVVFNPAVPVPKKSTCKKITAHNHEYYSGKFEDYIQNIKNKPLSIKGHINFYDSIIKIEKNK